MPNDIRELAAAIDRSARIRGEFTLRSGLTTHEYFDKYRFEADPYLLRLVAERIVPLLPEDTEVLGGLELGGVRNAALALRERDATVHTVVCAIDRSEPGTNTLHEIDLTTVSVLTKMDLDNLTAR